MKTLYLDCGMGAAGDMLTAALLELLPDPDSFISRLNALGIPGVEIRRERSVKCGIVGTHISVRVHGAEEDSEMYEHSHSHLHEGHQEHDHAYGDHHDHAHMHEDYQEHDHAHGDHHDHAHLHEGHHEHDHMHEHHHGSLEEIRHIVSGHMNLPEEVAADILNIYAMVADAESHVHGVPVTDIHFHEVGTMDAVADITAVCLLMHELSPDEVIVSPVHVGSGQVRCAHGILPVPAPATAWILQGVPIYGGSIRGELCTPTGAALLKYYATRFGDMPVMAVQKIGYGMGKKDFETANCVRAMLGDTAGSEDTVIEISCNVDDMTGEETGFAMDRLFAGGALDVYTIPIGMKKSRPGTLLRVMCRPQDKEEIIRLLYLHTSTIGVREMTARRHVLDRKISTVDTQYGQVRIKESSGYGVKRKKYEYEDIARIARENGISFAQAAALIRECPDNSGS